MENKQQQNKNKIVASPIVEPPPNKKTRQTNQLKFLTSSVLRLLVTHKDAWPFSRPINPKEIRIANYYEIIKTPMDLLSIRYRLKNNYYWSAKEAIDDFNLIFENAYKISKPDNLFHQYADNLKKYFLKLLEAMPSEEYEIGTNNENASGDKVKTSQIKAKRITKRRDTLPARVTESKVRISMDEDETEEKYDDEKSASDAEKSPDPVDFAENLKDRLDNLQNSLKMFQKTFTAQLTGLKSMVSDDAINDPVSNGNPIGPQQMNGICKKTSEKVKQKNAMTGPLSRKIPKLVERVKKLSEPQQDKVFLLIKECEPWIATSESGKFSTDLEAMKPSSILAILELLDKFKE